LAVLIIFLGVIGYVEYERLVRPYLNFYICCLPAAIIAGLLIFLGFSSRVTSVRRFQIQPPTQSGSAGSAESVQKTHDHGHGDFSETEVGIHDSTSVSTSQNQLRKYEPDNFSQEDLLAKKRNLQQFLNNLDEQHRDRLINSNVYLSLKAKYHHELSGVNSQLKSRRSRNAKKTKKLKVKDNKTS
jgi:hypothetical protein